MDNKENQNIENANLNGQNLDNQIKPINANGEQTSKDKKKKIFTIVLSVVLFIISFLGGYFVNDIISGKNANLASEIVSLMDKVGFVYDEQTGLSKPLTKEQIGDALVNSIYDKYSQYYTPEEYQQIKENSKGNYSGFGVTFFDEQDLIIDQVSLNSPFYNANLRAGDHIIACIKDGITTNFTNSKELSKYLQSILTNEQITVVYKRNEQINQVVVKKQVYKSSYVYYLDNEYEYHFVSNGLEEAQGVATKKDTLITDESVAYIYLSKFEGNAGIELGNALNFMKNDRNKTKLILDLRGNGGGYMGVLTYIASYFINNNGKNSSVVAIANGKSDTQTFSTTNNRFADFITDIRILADENTASASECLIGAIATYGEFNFKMENIIVEQNANGEVKTYGKGIMQTTYELVSGGAVKLTTAKILWPDKTTCIHIKGINEQMGCTASPKGQALSLALNSFN